MIDRPLLSIKKAPISEHYTKIVETQTCESNGSLLRLKSMQNCTILSYRTLQAQHPQLIKILTDFKTPSPCRVASDKFQPISGTVRPIRLNNSSTKNFDEASGNSWNSKEIHSSKIPVALNFKRSSILARRSQI